MYDIACTLKKHLQVSLSSCTCVLRCVNYYYIEIPIEGSQWSISDGVQLK